MITEAQAYTLGRTARTRKADWDVALEKFSDKHCTHVKSDWCELETAWADGWDDSAEGNDNRRPKRVLSRLGLSETK